MNDAVTTNRATAESRWSSKPRGQARLKAAAPRGVNSEKAAQAAKTAFEKTTVKEANGGEGKVTNGYKRDPDKGTVIVPLTASDATERHPRELMR